MTVHELWNVTTYEIYLENQRGADGLVRRVKLPAGGWLPRWYAEQIVTKITPVKRASESTYLSVETEGST